MVVPRRGRAPGRVRRGVDGGTGQGGRGLPDRLVGLDDGREVRPARPPRGRRPRPGGQSPRHRLPRARAVAPRRPRAPRAPGPPGRPVGRGDVLAAGHRPRRSARGARRKPGGVRHGGRGPGRKAQPGALRAGGRAARGRPSRLRRLRGFALRGAVRTGCADPRGGRAVHGRHPAAAGAFEDRFARRPRRPRPQPVRRPAARHSAAGRAPARNAARPRPLGVEAVAGTPHGMARRPGSPRSPALLRRPAGRAVTTGRRVPSPS